jgi:hypothetical protein
LARLTSHVDLVLGKSSVEYAAVRRQWPASNVIACAEAELLCVPHNQEPSMPNWKSLSGLSR